MFGLALLGVAHEAQAQEPEKSRAWTELALISNIRGPLGPAAFAFAVLPTPRLAVGLALGYSSSQSIWGHDNDFRPAIFARYSVLELEHFRLGPALMYSRGTYFGPDNSYWHHGDRLDATAAAEWVNGNWSLRLEGGVGRMLGDPDYTSGSRPHWFPNLQVAVAVRPGERQAEALELPPPPRTTIRILATGTPVVGAWVGCDCGYDYSPSYALGAETDLHYQISNHWRLGIGGRLDFSRGRSYGNDRTALIGFIPLQLGSFYRWDRTGEELELSFGLGFSFGKMQVGDKAETAIGMGGFGAELSLSYVRPVTAGLSMVVGIAVRLIQADATELHDTHIITVYTSVPLRLGVRW